MKKFDKKCILLCMKMILSIRTYIKQSLEDLKTVFNYQLYIIYNLFVSICIFIHMHYYLN